MRFGVEEKIDKVSFEELNQADLYLKELPTKNAVIFVAVIDGNTDHGNYIIFLNNDGFAHIILHEHQEFYPRDPMQDLNIRIQEFIDDDGSMFKVEQSRLTSVERALVSLKKWLPEQKKWSEYIW